MTALNNVLIHGLDTQEATIALGNAGVEIEHVLPEEGVEHAYLTFTVPETFDESAHEYLEMYRPRIIEMVTVIMNACERATPGGRPPGSISVVAMMRQLAAAREAKRAAE